jgi:hypothetical protein
MLIGNSYDVPSYGTTVNLYVHDPNTEVSKGYFTFLSEKIVKIDVFGTIMPGVVSSIVNDFIHLVK